MDDASKSDPSLNTVHLVNAVLCADCEVISDSATDVCEVCGSHSLLSLGRVLGGTIGDERAVLVPADPSEFRATFTLMVNPGAATTLRASRRWVGSDRMNKSGG